MDLKICQNLVKIAGGNPVPQTLIRSAAMKKIPILYFRLFIPVFPLLFSGCAGLPVREKPPAPALVQIPPEQFPAFSDPAEKEGFYAAAEKSTSYFDSISGTKKFYAVNDRRVSPALLAASIRELVKIMKESKDEGVLNRRIRESFDLYQSTGSGGDGRVVFSSYYEPILDASLKKTEEFSFPIYSRPEDLVEISLDQFDEQKWKGEKLFGRIKTGKVVPYFSREQIDFHKALAGRGLELAWFKNRADIMDLHIEGSGRLRLPDGTHMKARFSATNGLPFKGWMTVLVNSGVMDKNEITHEKAKKYLLEHQDIEPWILSTNRRYTFFELVPLKDPSEGPPGTLGIPLVGGRSVAVDPKIFPLGALAYMEAPLPRVTDSGDVLGITLDSRFVLCQDTGGAIQGPGRVDFFAGHGPKAKEFAFNLWEQGKFYILLLKFPKESEI